MAVQPVVITKSKTYILPYIDKHIPIKFVGKLLTTYCFYNNEYAFCLRYEYSAKKEFAQYEKELENNKYYKCTIDVNKKEVLYVFDIPEDLFDIVDLFMDGKYSYLPNKDIIIGFLMKNFGLTLENKIIKILNRDESLKQELEDQLNVRIPDGIDLSSPPDKDKENFINFNVEFNEKEEYIN